MGRASGDCSERPLGAVPAAGRPAPTLERLLELPGVDPLLEVAANLLAGRKQIVVAPAARRQVDDADALVTLAVTTRICGRLVERPKAVSTTPEPRHLWT